jgi:hypothetical protein
MKLSRLAAVLLFFAALYNTPAADRFPQLVKHRTFAQTPQHLDDELIKCLLWFRDKIEPNERPYYRFVDFPTDSDESLHDAVYYFHATLPSVSRGSAPVRPYPVDKAGRIWAIDLRLTRWTPKAFQAVTRIETHYREPHADHVLAETMRQAIGIEPDGTRTPHVEGLVPGRWFVREIMETDRRDDPNDQAYYNLLYARERFGDVFDKSYKSAPKVEKTDSGTGYPWNARVAVERADVWQVEGGVRKSAITLGKGSGFTVTNPADPGWYYGKTRSGIEGWILANTIERIPPDDKQLSTERYTKGDYFIDRNFPRDFDDWNKVWGGKAVQDFLDEQKIFKRNGAVVAGSRNVRGGGSIVSYHDRVIAFTRGGTGLLMRTWDFKKTAGRGNVANQPFQVALADLQEDAGEHIVEKEDGYPAWLLTNAAKAKRKRLEIGASDIVHASMPGQVSVLTHYTCIYCHAPDSIILAPSNKKVINAMKGGVDLLARSPEEKDYIEAFFDNLDEKLEKRKYDTYRFPFEVALKKATVNKLEPEGWTGEKWAKQTVDFRDWYDDPVSLDLAAAELGVSRLSVMLACLVEHQFRIAGKDADAFDSGSLFFDFPVPRDAWDDDLFPRLAAILAFARDAEVGDSALWFLSPDDVRYPYERFSMEKKK